MRTWTLLIATVLLAIPILGTSLRAADPELTDKQKIEQLQKEMKKLRDDVQQLRIDLTDNALRGNQIQGQLTEILRRLDSLAQQQQTIQRTSAYALPTGPGNPPPLTTGTITVENQFLDDAQVRINGQPYTVRAGQTIQVPRIPTGQFEYSVEMNGAFIQPPRLDTLHPSGYIIRIFRVR